GRQGIRPGGLARTVPPSSRQPAAADRDRARPFCRGHRDARSRGPRTAPGGWPMRRLFVLALSALLLAAGHANAALQEMRFFAEVAASGKLPAVQKRIPREPALAELEALGRPGGELRMLMASPKDTRLMVVYGYARLVAYTPALA